METLGNFGKLKYQAKMTMEQIENKEVLIEDCDFFMGQFHPCVAMRICLPDGKRGTVITSAVMVVSAAEEVKKRNQLPIKARFYRVGKSWLCE